MNCLVNDKGEYLEILYEEKEPLENQRIVPLEGYYDVFNVDNYSQAVWDFELNKWIGLGEPNIPHIPKPTEIEILRQEKEVLAKSVYELTSIVELLVQGGVS